MKIIYVNTPMQDENTPNPQVIDGEIPKWCVETEFVKQDRSLRQFFEYKWSRLQQHPKGDSVIGFYLYDVHTIHGIMDENKNFTGQSVIAVRFAYIRKQQ